jgi:SH3-like domain-containing protein
MIFFYYSNNNNCKVIWSKNTMTRYDIFQARTGFGLSIFLFVLFFSFTVSAAEFVSVKKDGINIRSGPNTKAEVLWEVFKDFPLKIVKRQGKWTQVEDFEGDRGWIYAPLISKKHTVIVKVKTANMRIGPSKNYEVVATVKKGVVFKLGENDGNWHKVLHEDGTSGWIHQKLLWPIK